VVPTSAEESYLKAIYHLSTGGVAVTTSAIAGRLGVASPSVSAMLKRLEGAGLIGRQPDHRIELTDEGEHQAMRMVRRHRLLETMLHQLIGVPWHEVHDDAEALEHAMSDRLEARIDAALGHPERDPHGDPIPPADLRTHREAWPDPLSAAPVETHFRVERVSDRNADALDHLARMGVVPGTVIWLDRRDPFDALLWIRIEESPVDSSADARVHQEHQSAQRPTAHGPKDDRSALQALGPTLTALIHGTEVEGRLCK
jgi:DtxR family Mn-dependent transcriptional regulator